MEPRNLHGSRCDFGRDQPEFSPRLARHRTAAARLLRLAILPTGKGRLSATNELFEKR
jgi:hypothetical protein